jgi:prevent-host-death family protein
MDEVTIRELRNHGGDVIDRVISGEHLTITRDGRAVAELRPLPHPATPARVLVERWSRLPEIDPQQFRADIDDAVDAIL